MVLSGQPWNVVKEPHVPTVDHGDLWWEKVAKCQENGGILTGIVAKKQQKHGKIMVKLF
jgi:hypothetical protein